MGNGSKACGEDMTCWLRVDDFRFGGLPGLLFGDVGLEPTGGGVSLAGDSCGERRELISMASRRRRRAAQSGCATGVGVDGRGLAEDGCGAAARVHKVLVAVARKQGIRAPLRRTRWRAASRRHEIVSAGDGYKSVLDDDGSRWPAC